MRFYRKLFKKIRPKMRFHGNLKKHIPKCDFIGIFGQNTSQNTILYNLFAKNIVKNDFIRI